MRNKQILNGAAAVCAMLVIILDTKTAMIGAQEGINLCVQTVVPSLFPFFVLSGIINSQVLGHSVCLMRPLGRLCGIPKGSESLLVIGLIAGYPIGAQLTANAFKSGYLPKETAKRMLGFCNNAGPAFLFGMLAQLFHNAWIPWLLWFLHISTAITVGCILPGRTNETCKIADTKPLTLQQSLQSAIRAMAGVCGWVIVFRIILTFCGRWFLWLLPINLQILFSGLLELSNGCLQIRNISSEGLRFVLSSTILASGGLCVGMQTASVTGDLGTGWYFPGKILQCLLSASVSCFIQPLIFSDADVYFMRPSAFFVLIMITAFYIYFIRRKKGWNLRKKYCIIKPNIP